MERQYVQSSNLNSIGYDAINKILEIEFKDGGIYHYFGVPKSEYDNLMSAISIGAYHAQYIKDVYDYQKI